MENNQSELPLSGMGAEEAGKFIRERRMALGLTLADVMGRTTVPNVPYLSRIESGQVNLNRSKHLASLVPVLKLTPIEVSRLTGLPSSAVPEELTSSPQVPPDPLATLLQMKPVPLAIPTILGCIPTGEHTGAYTLAEDPTQDPNLTVFIEFTDKKSSNPGPPPPLSPVAGAHYVGISHEHNRVLRVQCFQGTKGTVLVGNKQVLDPTKVVLFGRIIFEGRTV